MKSLAAPTFRLEPFSPPLDRAFRGVKIAFSSPPLPSALPHVQVAVAYVLDEAGVETLGGKLPGEALILTVIGGKRIFSGNLLGDTVLFEDDYHRKDGLCYGHVNFRPADHFRFVSGYDYYITLSLGTWLSNTLILPRETPTAGAQS
ncbi:MAG: hypothetical protein ABIW76_03750 [Fibrobacteria bacterium]